MLNLCSFTICTEIVNFQLKLTVCQHFSANFLKAPCIKSVSKVYRNLMWKIMMAKKLLNLSLIVYNLANVKTFKTGT